MAARLNKRHQDFVREKIKASQLVNRLTDHAFGEIELSTSQIRAIEILLNKSVPNLSNVALTGEDGGPVEISTIERKIVKPKA
jgi:flagellar biosynthesis/type III secretory pathway M-ring protein FliF/YscJ